MRGGFRTVTAATVVVGLGLGTALLAACSPSGIDPSSASNDLIGLSGSPAGTSGGSSAAGGPVTGSPSGGSPSPSGPSGTNSGTGALSIRLTDSPFGDALAVLVTFSEVRVHRSDTAEDEAEEGEGEGEEVEAEGDGGGWETVPFPVGVTSITCDLKQLEDGSIDLLGFGVLPAGHYTQIRLAVASASIHFDSAAALGPCAPTLAPLVADPGFPVKVPSGVVKLARQFTIEEGGTTSILLDFDGDKSIVKTGPPVSVAGGSGNGNGNGNAGGNGNGKSNKPGGDDEDQAEDVEDEDEDGPGNSGGPRYILKPVIRVVSVQQGV